MILPIENPTPEHTAAYEDLKKKKRKKGLSPCAATIVNQNI